MNKLYQMEYRIQELKDIIFKITEQKPDLADSKVTEISQKLDRLLELYREIKENNPI